MQGMALATQLCHGICGMYLTPEYIIELCQEDFDAFMAILDNPPPPNEKLKALLSAKSEMRINEPRCPYCGRANCQPYQEHGHYVQSICRQIIEGCCNGESGM